MSEPQMVPMTDLVVMWCHDCSAERAFERPECRDGHGGDCTEWACTDCGLALIVGDILDDRLGDPLEELIEEAATPARRRRGERAA